ncbi:MAG TPA: SIMPL domain-containing protein [Flavobacteriales bacterium]|nr:SIMPL domain-containing protein [Flavobacteriales bacterium]
MSEIKDASQKSSEEKESVEKKSGWKSSKSVKFIAIAIVIAVFINSLFKILGAGLPYFYKDLIYEYQTKKIKADINVKGYHQEELESDLIVWEASFESWDMNKRTAFSQLKRDREEIKRFLTNKGIKESEITFKATWDRQNWDHEDELIEGSTTRTNEIDIFRGWTLGQTLIIESNNVDLVEEACNEITDLIESDINISSGAPKYYYTNLEDQKIATIEAAAEDGLLRAKTAVEGGDGELGELQETSIGTFQILGKNSDEDISWGGSFNTSHKIKTISVTVNQRYSVE